ncbi:MAG: PQQ-dependent sugar dehydrogenase [Anaerolineales bacterium]|nr:PQQ-dependent sugar dehydrogenase [Anaerolineales bacterium]
MKAKQVIGTVFSVLTLSSCSLFTPASLPATVQPTIPTVQNSTPQPTPEPVQPTGLPAETPILVTVNSFPNPVEYHWTPVLTGLKQPVDIQHARDGSGRMFLIERYGRIRVAENSEMLSTPFLDISTKVRSQESEQGLLGLAFHPDYQQNGYFFVNYIDRQGNTVIARYQVSIDDPNRVKPLSETILMQVEQPYANHNGGGMAFGPDGYLYIGLGDGGSGGDPQNNAQSLETYLGKLLRLNVDTVDTPYGVPIDNPFNNIQRSEIWAYGLRNPWRFSFDRSTGDLYIGDVGQGAWEEINYLPAGSPGGANFGWKIYEGLHVYEGPVPDNMVFAVPAAEYDHTFGCSVTGGYVYRGSMPDWQGIYFYGDFCNGRIWGLLPVYNQWQIQELFRLDFNLSTFGEDENGELYAADYTRGVIYRLEGQ